MKSLFSKLIATSVVGLGLASIAPVASAAPFTQCPTVGVATSCAVLYTYNADGSATTQVDSAVLSTDGTEDTLVGVQNNSLAPIMSIHLTGTGTSGIGIFGFDGDGVSNVSSTGTGTTYFGMFQGVTGDGANTFTLTSATDGLVVFGNGGLKVGGTAWFVLEDQIDFNAPPTPIGVPSGNVPVPASLALVLLGLVGLVRRRS